MAIDILYLKSVAKNFLEVLNRDGINSVDGVVNKLGGRFRCWFLEFNAYNINI